ncbi:GNAT family N-acetyltransferase [Bosea caraganae]|uniref:GNAT family N-acetyltransferase n=1 Tax=Bosea caraganae TaxID=2763117 RepID=A0A370L898_9HYPH|nr:GNAT family N-acetyltransferase [Bosea caraganae]RDJ26623.1 GNAT family N-acetyltransferase [Bosea caraganae]RDJ30509.1 GNAT family N-acetyltransferase [Bosea caraganae]
MDWLRKLLHPTAGPARTGPLDARQARDVAALHHLGGFARGWDPGECAALIADASVVTDGVFAGKASTPSGFAMSRKAADEAEILSIVVATGQRGSGLGRALLAAHLGQLAAMGVTCVFLEVEDGNVAADRLYRHFGFREVGRRKGYYPKPDGSKATAVTMRLDLA